MWFRKPPEPGRAVPGSPAAELVSARAALVRMSGSRPELSALAQDLDAILTEAYSVRDHPFEETDRAALNRIAEGLEAGRPALFAVIGQVSLAAVAERFGRIATVVGRVNPAAAGIGQRLCHPEAIRDALSDRLARVVDEAASSRAGTDPEDDLVSAILRFALLPTLAAWPGVLAPTVANAGWTCHSCPICGYEPLLGELRGLERGLHLRCGTCGSDRPAPRLGCPLCKSRDVTVLTSGPHHDRVRLLACSQCDCRLVLVSTLEPIPTEHLAVVELETIVYRAAALSDGLVEGSCAIRGSPSPDSGASS